VRRWSWSYWRLPLASLLLCTALCELIASRLHPINLILIYLVGVLYVALKRDLLSSIATLLGAILIFDWIFVAPRWSLKPTDPEYFFTFAIALCVGLAVSRLATRAREAAVEALAVADRAQSMSLLAQSLSAVRTSEEIVRALQLAVARGVGATGEVLLVEGLSSETASPSPPPSAVDALSFDLQAAGGSLGELRVTHLPAQRQTAEDRHLLQSLANQAALALDRLNADLRSQQAAIQAETERVRNTLLAAISHDFRTPLTAIIGAASTVMTQGRQITPEQHDSLLHHMLDQARRLQSLTSDLLDLARLQDGAVTPEQEWCPVGELVRDALAVTRGALESHVVELQVAEDDIVWCDARLVTQAMCNLLLNASQHSPAGSRMVLAVRLHEDAWTLSVSDQGPAESQPPAHGVRRMSGQVSLQVLVVDDEPAIRDLLRATLQAEGYGVIEAATAREGATLAGNRRIDLFLIDLGLPDGDGVALIREIRGWTRRPILVLSARTQEQQKVDALDAGADDFVSKPFGVAELHARIRVALRHAGPQASSGTTLVFGDVTIDLLARHVSRSGTPVRLTATQWRLLEVLARHAGRVVSSRQLLREVWGPGHGEQGHYLRIYVRQLRQKLEQDPTQPQFLQTEMGVGYRLLDKGDAV